MQKSILIALGLSLIAGCSSTPEKQVAAEPARAEERSGLVAQSLAPGDCGLFLWNRTDAKTFLFFQRAGEGGAVYFDEAETAVTAVSVDGQLFGQFFTQSEWQLPDGRILSLTIVPGDEMDGGQRVRSGIITVADEEGWRTKTPVAGVRACQAEQG